MGFDSIGFYFFLYALICLSWFWRASPALLLAGSVVFYATLDPWHLPLLITLTTLSYFGARGSWSLRLLVPLALLPLAIFKVAEARSLGWVFPLGISFYTFHCISYVVDVRRGVVAPEKSFTKFALYISFFPQLVAGPITRAREMLPQFGALARPEGAVARRAGWRIYGGLLKKLAIANVAGFYAREVFAHPSVYRGYVVLLAVVAGRYFIFADFSGYTDIAIGSARLLGITLPENFRRPFAASSLADYWRRWHITLQSWIRDYVFFPLAATPAGTALGTYPLVITTFLLLGSWHGLGWNFLLYGLWHGSFLVLHDATRVPRQAALRALGLEKGLMANWLLPWLTFLLLVCPPTILFLSPTPADALAVLHALGQSAGRTIVKGTHWYHLVSALATLLAVELFHWLRDRKDCFELFERLQRPVRWGAILFALAWLGFAGEFGSDTSFLYFQF